MIVPINNEEYSVLLSDTAGQEEYDRLRPLAYTDVGIRLLKTTHNFDEFFTDRCIHNLFCCE